MIYGKVECRIEARETAGGRIHDAVMLTVTGTTTTIKQSGDLVRLTWQQAEELARDINEAMRKLKNHSNIAG